MLAAFCVYCSSVSRNLDDMNIQGVIPVRAYLKQYVIYRENLAVGQPLDLSRKGTIPMVLGSLLGGKMNLDRQRDGYEPNPSYYDASLPFVTDFWRGQQGRIILTTEAVRMFDSFLYSDFHDYLLTRILASRAEKGKEKDVIEAIMEELDIVEHITFDALKKAQLRLRNTRKIPGFRNQNSLGALSI